MATVVLEEEALRRLVREEAQAAVSAALAAQERPGRLLTAREAAAHLGMSEAALRRSSQRWAQGKSGVPCVKLPSSRVRYRLEDLEQYIEAGAS